MKNKLNHQNKPKSQSKLKITTRCNGRFGVFTSGKLRTVFSAIMPAFYDNANCVKLWSLENEYSLLWSTLNLLKTIKRKTPTDKLHTLIRIVVGAIKLSDIRVYIGQTQENNVSAIMRVFFDNANCVEFRSLENEYSLLWSTLTTLNFLKTIKRKTPMYKWHLHTFFYGQVLQSSATK